MLVTYRIPKNTPLTEEQIQELEEAAKRPIVYDDDSPELTPALEKALRCAAVQRNRMKSKKVSGN